MGTSSIYSLLVQLYRTLSLLFPPGCPSIYQLLTYGYTRDLVIAFAIYGGVESSLANTVHGS